MRLSSSISLSQNKSFDMYDLIINGVVIMRMFLQIYYLL
jgi:hypothetical protein